MTNTTHYTEQQWLAYALGEEIGRDTMEAHLVGCESCLASYLAAIEQADAHLPELPDTQAFAEKVIEHIAPPPVIRSDAARRSWFMKPLVQYAIAASITIVLVGSGMFHQLFEGLSDLSRQAEYGDKATISEQLTKRADRWLDSIPNIYIQKREGIE